MKTLLSSRCFAVWSATLGLVAVQGHAQAIDAPVQKPLGETSTIKQNPLNADFAGLARRQLEEWHVPGISVAVVDGGDTWAEGYGIATFPNTPVTPSTLFYAGSTSKAHTAALLAHIIDSGNFTTDLGTPLSWSSPISSVLRDDFVLQDEWATRHLTLADAASHRTGMPRHDTSTIHVYYDESGEWQRLATARDVVRTMRYLPMTAEPRTKWQYCNLMYVALAHVIETLSGGRWMGDVLRETLWAPLGMNSTYFSLDEALAAPEHLAQGYYWDEEVKARDGGQGRFVPIPFWEGDELGGAGGVISSVEDYSRWIRFWIDEAAPISKAAHRAVKAPLMIDSPDAGMFDAPTAYAAGWVTGSYRSHRFWYHNGGTDAYGSELWVFPDLQFGAVTLGNTAGGANAVGTALLGHLIDDKLGVPEHERKDWNQPTKQALKSKRSIIDNASDVLFPNHTDPPLSPSLPLEKYSGTYYHPGYQYMKLQLGQRPGGRIANATLFAERPGFTWRSVCDFVHVSAESWVLYLSLLAGESERVQEIAVVQFRVRPDGEVSAMGIEWRANFAVEGWIWYDKVD